jgi:hypothetical protein
MSNAPLPPGAGVPRWLIWVGSVLIVGHLLALGSAVLAVPSGPWPNMMEGPTMFTPPQFAFSLNNVATPGYLEWLKLTHSYHFPSNRPRVTEAFLEFRLKNAKGEEIATVTLPDPKANAWVRFRQGLLAKALCDDQPYVASTSETIAAPNQQALTVPIWDGDQKKLTLKRMPEHLLPRNQAVYRPSDWNMVLARSFERYLCRSQGAKSAEIIRHSREPIPPMVLFMDPSQIGPFDELISNYGELLR